MSKMMEIATRYANGEEEDRLRSGKGKAVDNGPNGGNPSRKQKRKPSGSAQAEVATLAAKGKAKPKGPFVPKKSKNQLTDVLDLPCPLHSRRDEEGNVIPAKHTTRQCRLLIEGFKGEQLGEKGPDKDETKRKKISLRSMPPW